MRFRLSACGLSMLLICAPPLLGQRKATGAAVSTSATPRAVARFEVVPTQNMWTFLLLDSSTGKVWQIQYSLSDTVFAGRLAINDSSLAIEGAAHSGRFSLRETQNIYTFLLLDRDDGRVWQVQWSTEEMHRGIVRSLSDAVVAVPPRP